MRFLFLPLSLLLLFPVTILAQDARLSIEPSFLLDPEFLVTVDRGPPYLQYDFEITDNLVDWTSLDTPIFTGGAIGGFLIGRPEESRVFLRAFPRTDYDLRLDEVFVPGASWRYREIEIENGVTEFDGEVRYTIIGTEPVNGTTGLRVDETLEGTDTVIWRQYYSPDFTAGLLLIGEGPPAGVLFPTNPLPIILRNFVPGDILAGFTTLRQTIEIEGVTIPVDVLASYTLTPTFDASIRTIEGEVFRDVFRMVLQAAGSFSGPASIPIAGSFVLVDLEVDATLTVTTEYVHGLGIIYQLEEFVADYVATPVSFPISLESTWTESTETLYLGE